MDDLANDTFPYLNKALHEVPTAMMGGRSLIMMVSHPMVAQGVSAHSSYDHKPFIRLWDTLSLATALSSGTAEDRRYLVDLNDHHLSALLHLRTAIDYIHMRHDTINGEGYTAHDSR
jgi:uncharacterized protein (DUF2236 family)